MAITNRCITAVMDKMGREVKEAELIDIESRIARNRAMMAREDINAYRSMTEAQQVLEAGKRAADEMLQEAAHKKANAARDLLKKGSLTQEMQTRIAKRAGKKDAGARALYDIQQRVFQVQNGIKRQYFRGLLDVIDAIPGKYAGFMHDVKSANDVVKEIYGIDTGNAMAKKAAKAWNEVSEQMRVRANAAGADIGKLSYAYLPQSHNTVKMMKATKKIWVEKTLPLLDRQRYMDDAGNLLPEESVRKMLSDAYDTITTGGLNKMEPGSIKGKGGSIAKRHDAHRAIHFKDGDAHLAYAAEFGKGNLIAAMQGHIATMARDIALMEEMGPGAKNTFSLLNDIATKADGDVKNVGWAVNNEHIFNSLAGLNHPANVRAGEIMQGLRNIQSAAKLGGAVLSSFTDTVTLASTAWYNGIPLGRMFADIPYAAGSAEYKAYANKLGFMADSVMSSMNRWAEGDIGEGWTSRMADVTFRVSLLNAWTDSLKSAYAVNMSAALGDISKKPWTELHAKDMKRLERAGITADIFDIWHKAEKEDWRGQSVLNADAIMRMEDIPLKQRQNAAARLIGYIDNEMDTAITSVDLLQQSRSGRLKKGDAFGEIGKSIMQFKSFPLALLSRQIDRLADINDVHGTGAAIGYAASVFTGLTAMGALSIQAKSLAAGKDPEDMTKLNFWWRAVIQGGGLGIMGDVFKTGFSGEGRAGASNYATLIGPLIGSGFEIADISMRAIATAVDPDKQKDMSADFLRWAKGNAPVPFINLWYTRAAFDRLVMNDLQEAASPGYLGRMRGRVKKETGQEFFAPPGTTNVRMPNFAAAIGE